MKLFNIAFDMANICFSLAIIALLMRRGKNEHRSENKGSEGK